MRKNQADLKKLQDAEKFLRELSFTSIRVYGVDRDHRYPMTTDASNLIERATQQKHVVNLSGFDSLYRSFSADIKKVRLLEIYRNMQMDLAVTFYSWGVEKITIYLSWRHCIIQIRNDHFVADRDAQLFKTLKKIRTEKMSID